ncbi:MAG: hypothetical protein J1E04_01490 [Alistipes sp.]|nr:hypothetical protein [Alistipes sp.]
MTDSAEPAGGQKSPYLQEITVTRTPLALANDEADADTDPDAKPKTEPEEPAPLYDGEVIYDAQLTPGRSILYVSQRTRNSLPFSKAPDAPPTYQYVNYKNDDANWDEGFNFQPDVPENFDPTTQDNPYALNWEEVGSFGSVGNGFALCAMFYPDNVNGTRTVATNQSKLEDLQRSDIQAAYHSTSALYSRIRFRLYHLMVYYKINLYVPAFQTTMKGGEEQDPSGYLPAQLIEACVKQVCPNFTIDWATGVTSDKSPAVILNDSDHTLYDIQMYSHAHSEDTLVDETVPAEPEPDTDDLTRAGSEGGSLSGDGDESGEQNSDEASGDIRPLKKTKINVYPFLTDDMLKIQPLDYDAKNLTMYDDVYQYSFSVIIPAQYDDFYKQEPGWLHFEFLKTGGIHKHYYFQSGFSGHGMPGQVNSIVRKSGVLQVLNLYLPRKGDEVILIGAEVEPWIPVETDEVTLQQKDKDKNDDKNGYR